MNEELNECGDPSEELLQELDQQSLEQELQEESIRPIHKLDGKIESPEERTELVKKIIEETPPEQLTPRYLEILSNYIIYAMSKRERQEKKILTSNRMVTVNKRETSYQGLVAQLENGEDGIYNMIANDKNIIFSPKVGITEKDKEEIPALRALCEAIEQVEAQEKVATGKQKYLLKNQLIEMHQDKYVIKNAYRQPIYSMNLTKSITKLELNEKITINPDTGEPESNCVVSLFNPKHVSLLLCNYSKIKEESWDKLDSDARWLMEDLDNLTEKTLRKDYPLYYDLLIYKIDGKSNLEIQDLLKQKHNIKHSVEYLSSLWRNKIPKLIAEKAKEDYLIYHYTEVERGAWKKCSRCGEIKLAHNRFFSRNKTSRDGWYSICKCCRNKKK